MDEPVTVRDVLNSPIEPCEGGGYIIKDVRVADALLNGKYIAPSTFTIPTGRVNGVMVQDDFDSAVDEDEYEAPADDTPFGNFLADVGSGLVVALVIMPVLAALAYAASFVFVP